jgi:flagellar basal-body rod protein FlgF
MSNAIYVALTSQLKLFNSMDVIGDNIANASTSGFNKANVIAHPFVIKTSPREELSYGEDIATVLDTRNGPIAATDRPLDLAIEGDGWFVVNTPLGQRYTKAGNFQLDSSGFLVTSELNQVLDITGQPIRFNPGESDIMFDLAGNVLVNGEGRGALGVVKFDQPNLIEHVGNGLYQSPIPPNPSTGFQIKQGMLMNSNVEPVAELTEMIQIQRASELVANVLNVLYGLKENTVKVLANSAKS